MSAWLEQRLHLKKWFCQPVIPRGVLLWCYLPGIFGIVLLLWQLWSGIFSSLHTPQNYVDILSDANREGSFLSNGHKWGAHLLLVCVGLHLFVNLYRGAYRKLRELQWSVGIAMACTILLLFATGSLLSYYPQSQRVIQILYRFPIIGSYSIELLLPGSNPNISFNRIWIIHISFLPLLAVSLLLLHLWLGSRQRMPIIMNLPKRKSTKNKV